MNKYDIIIIGSGLGGLQTAYILSKEGYNVCVLEKNHQFGGVTQNFVRDGVKFDTGIHYIGSYDKGQVLHNYFKYFGLTDKLDVKRLDSNAFDIISFNNEEKRYNYANGDKFAKQLIEYFPEEKDAILKYSNKLQEISDSLPLFNFEYSPNFSPRNKDVTSGIYDYLKTITTNKRLQNVLTGSNMIYAGDKHKTPIYVHSVINKSYIDSAYKFNNGSEQLANELIKSIREFGGTVLKKKEVINFSFKDKEIEFVETKDGELYYADKFISNIHPRRTFDMIPRDKVRKAFYNRVQSVSNTISYYNLFITFKEKSFKYFNSNVYHINDDSSWVASSYRKKNWPQYFMFIPTQKNPNDEYANGASIFTYMEFDEVSKWGNSTVEKRGDEYKAFKQMKNEQFLDAIELRFPNFRKQIKNVYASSPLTVRDYTGCNDGAMYGIVKDFNNPLHSYFTPKTKIPNLLLTGQNTVLHGVVGVTIGAVLTAGEIVGLKYLFSKIKKSV